MSGNLENIYFNKNGELIKFLKGDENMDEPNQGLGEQSAPSTVESNFIRINRLSEILFNDAIAIKKEIVDFNQQIIGKDKYTGEKESSDKTAPMGWLSYHAGALNSTLKEMNEILDLLKVIRSEFNVFNIRSKGMKSEWKFGDFEFWQIVNFVECMQMDDIINFHNKDKFCDSLLILLEEFEKLKEAQRRK